MALAMDETRVADRIWNELEAELTPTGEIAPLSILYATDGSVEAKRAEALLQKLPLPAGSSVHVLVVTAGAEWTMPEWFVAGEHAWGEKVATEGARALAREGVTSVGTSRSGAVAYEIIEAAEEYHVDLIVVGSKGLTGLAGFVLGSVARNVAKHARRSVLVARELRHDLKHVLLAIDGSPHAERAVRLMARLPLPADTIVQVAQVVTVHQPYAVVAPEFLVEYHAAMTAAEKQETAAAQARAQAVCDYLRRHGKQAEPLVLHGDPADEILKAVGTSETDLVIAGARGVSLIEGLLVGSVADRLLKMAPCSVLLAR
jgi:nucleotide-binding universal stress UspA family protein